MRSRILPRKSVRICVCLALFTLPAVLNGCIFYIDHLVPNHGNVGDRCALRNPEGVLSPPPSLQVWFAATPSQSILQQSPGEIVAEIPSGPLGEVPVSVWQDLFLVSNVKTFRVDAQPIAHRILAFGDSLVGPWVYHTDLLDTMLNANVGPSLVINEGKAGETLLEGARRLGDILSIHNAVRHVYILEGANDVSDFRNTPAGEMLAALNQMMDTLGTHGLSPILVTLPPRTREALSEDRTWPTTEDWNRTLRLYAIVNRIKWFDLYNAFVTQPDWESFLDDSGLHLSEQGQHFVAQAMYSALAPLLH